MTHRSFIVACALLAIAACDCGETPPPDDTFDGNVIVGDAAPPDSSEDAEADAGDGGDAADVPEPDAEPADADAAMDAADADAGSICDEDPVAVLSATTAAAEASTYDGMVVEITGTATRTDFDCTSRRCLPEMPCCNTCTATISVGGVWLIGGPCFAPPPGCTGTECAQTCRPPLLGVSRSFVGTLIDRGATGAALELHTDTD